MHELHDERRSVIEVDEALDPHNARMLNPREEPGFVSRPVQDLGVGGVLCLEHFEGDLALKGVIDHPGDKYCTKRTFTQHFGDLKWAGDERQGDSRGLGEQKSS